MHRLDEHRTRLAGGLAGNERELDALEHRGIAAWVEVDPDTGAPDDPIRAVEDGFVDRVMDADADASDPLYVLPDDLDPFMPSPRPWRSIAMRLAGGVAVGVGVGLVLALALRPTSTSDTQAKAHVSSPPAASRSNTAHPILTPPAKPRLRPDGDPGTPIPGSLAGDVADYIADYGRFWGPAFEFHGSVVVSRGDDILYAEGFGVADPASGRPGDPQTRYRLGMLTEQFTAAAILQLRDRGKLDLDDPIDRFLPEFPRGNQITIRHLLSHRSGLANYTEFPDFHTWKSRAHTTGEMVARIANAPLHFEPGTDFEPTNSGYFLLGAIIERVSGKSFAQYLETHVFEPAGMTTASVGETPAGALARGHVWNDEELLDPPEPIDMSVFGAAGAVVASPLDLVAWSRALGSRTVLSPESVDEMNTPGPHDYGFGVVVSRGYGQPVVSFPGAIDGFNGALLRFLEDETTVAVLCNTEVVPCNQVAMDVAMLVYGDEPPRRREHAEVGIAPGVLSQYVGVYGVTSDTRERYADRIEDSRFDLLDRVYVRQIGERLYFDVPGHGMTWMHPMGHDQFFFKDHSGSTVSFDLDEADGTMTVHYHDADLVLARSVTP